MSDTKPLNDIQLRYLLDLDKQIDKLGQQMEEKRKLMLELLKGRRVKSYGSHFQIEHAALYQSGSGGTRVYVSGPCVTKTGALHKRNMGSVIFSMIEEIDQ